MTVDEFKAGMCKTDRALLFVRGASSGIWLTITVNVVGSNDDGSIHVVVATPDVENTEFNLALDVQLEDLKWVSS